MAVKEVVWSKLAEAELLNVLEFYLERNGNSKYSLKLLNEVEELMYLLSRNENLGRLTNNKFTRVIPLKNYAVFYEVSINRIEIISFWDFRQDPERNKVK